MATDKLAARLERAAANAEAESAWNANHVDSDCEPHWTAQSEYAEDAAAIREAAATISALEAENKRLRKREASLEAILNEMVDRDLAYDGGNIVIPTVSHGNAIALVRRARDLSRNRRETP